MDDTAGRVPPWTGPGQKMEISLQPNKIAKLLVKKADHLVPLELGLMQWNAAFDTCGSMLLTVAYRNTYEEIFYYSSRLNNLH